MSYFNSDFIAFFKELAANNNKDWFDENRKRYEDGIREPFKRFLKDLIAELAKENPALDIETKNAMFRINRDVRFSKDKTPYQTHVSAVIAPGGKKNRDYPGLYLNFSAVSVTVGGGLYGMDKEALYFLRDYIAKHPKKLQDAISDKDFVKHFGEIMGEKNKVLPAEFKAHMENTPLIANKDFFYMKELPASTVTSEQLLQIILDGWKASSSVRNFLLQGVTSTWFF